MDWLLQHTVGRILDQEVTWILNAVRTALNVVWHLLAITLFHLPDVTRLPAVLTVASRSLLVVNTSYGLVIMVTGLLLVSGVALPIRYTAGELFPRLVIGLVAANFAVLICSALITVTNTLVMALTGQGIAPEQSLRQLQPVIADRLTDPVSGLLAVLIAVVLLVLVVMLTAGWVTRFIALVVLCAVAPLALACHGTPWTDVAARLWWRSMFAVVLTVLLQALAMNTSLQIFFSPAPGAPPSDTNLAALGFPTDPSGMLTLLFVAILLWTTVRIPAMVAGALTQSGGRPNLVGTLVRLVIAQQITRGLGQVLRTAAATAGHGAHRVGHARHASGRTTGDPLRGFTAPPVGPRVGTHRQDRTRRGTERDVADPLQDFLPVPGAPWVPVGRRAGTHREDPPRHGTEREGPDPLRDFLYPPTGPARAGTHHRTRSTQPRPAAPPSSNAPGPGPVPARLVPQGVNPRTVFGNRPRTPPLGTPAPAPTRARLVPEGVNPRSVFGNRPPKPTRRNP